MKPLLARCAWLLAFAAAASAQPLGFSLLPAEGSAPTPRIDGTIAYDAGSRRILLFGGDDGQPRNDLWSYSLATRRWEALSPTGTPPAPRFGHTAIFDAAGRRLIVFGGQARGFFSDVWAYETEANRWTQLAAEQAGPSRRYGHSAIYDAPRRRMVISHGFTDAGRFDDTWAFDLTARTWSDISPRAGRPLRRCLHHSVYDNANQRMLLFGGCASGAGPCPLGDLWSYDLVNGGWREISGPGPSPRDHYGISFEDANQRAIVFSGSGAANDTWAFDARSNRWSALTVANAPAARSRHQGAAIGDRGTTVFFGGRTNAGMTNELWLLGPAFVSPAPRVTDSGVADAFTGQTGGVAPGQIVSIYGTGLGPIEPVTLAFDASTLALPKSGPGVMVRFNSVAAPLYYVSAGQLNVQVPYEIAGASTAEVSVEVNGQTSEPVAIPVFATRPGLFPRVWNEDGTVNEAGNPARAGSVVVLYATGQGLTVPASRSGGAPEGVTFPVPAAAVRLEINGVAAELLFTGQAPGTAGVMQINARVPASITGPVTALLRVGEGEPGRAAFFVR